MGKLSASDIGKKYIINLSDNENIVDKRACTCVAYYNNSDTGEEYGIVSIESTGSSIQVEDDSKLSPLTIK